MPGAFSGTRNVAWDNSDNQQRALIREMSIFAEQGYIDEQVADHNSVPEWAGLPVFGGVVSPSGRRRR
jgi:hypothetical protein